MVADTLETIAPIGESPLQAAKNRRATDVTIGKPSYRVDAIGSELIKIIAARYVSNNPDVGKDAVFKTRATEAVLLFVHANVQPLCFRTMASLPDRELNVEIFGLLNNVSCTDYAFVAGYVPRCAL